MNYSYSRIHYCNYEIINRFEVIITLNLINYSYNNIESN